MIKNAIWNCVIEDDSSVVKKDQNVDLRLLMEVMNDIKVYIDYAKLQHACQDLQENKRTTKKLGQTGHTNEVIVHLNED